MSNLAQMMGSNLQQQSGERQMAQAAAEREKAKRTITVVATELKEAIDVVAAGRLAQQKVIALRKELDALIGKARKPRAVKVKP